MNIDSLHISIKARELIEKDGFNKKAIEGYEDRPNLRKFSFFMYKNASKSSFIESEAGKFGFKDIATSETHSKVLNFKDSYYVMFLGMAEDCFIFVDSLNLYAYHVPKKLLKLFIAELLLKSSINLLNTGKSFYEDQVSRLDTSNYEHFKIVEKSSFSVIDK